MSAAQVDYTRRPTPHVRVWVPRAEDMPDHHAGLTAMLDRTEELVAFIAAHGLSAAEVHPDEHVLDGVRHVVVRAPERASLDVSAVALVCLQLERWTGVEALFLHPFRDGFARQILVEANRLRLAYDNFGKPARSGRRRLI